MLRISCLVLLLAMIDILQAQEPQPFEPGLFKDMPYVRDFAMTGNGEEIYFTVDDYRHSIGFIVRINETAEGWSKPEVLPFSGKYRDIEPFLTVDNKRLYFASNRPTDSTSNKVKDFDLYYVERDSVDAPWGQPVRLPEPINGPGGEYFPSVTDAGDLYFTSSRDGGKGNEDIFEAHFQDGEYMEPYSIPGEANTESYEYNASISPDGTYIIYSSYRDRDGQKRNDLYISFRDDNGIWGAGRLIPGIYSDALDYCPFVDRNSNRLYFTSERNSIAKHYSEALSFEEFMEIVKTGPNGLGRIYWVEFGEILEALRD